MGVESEVSPEHRDTESDGHHEESGVFTGALSEGVHDHEWTEGAGEGGPSKNDKGEDVGRSEEGARERDGDDGRSSSHPGPRWDGVRL